LDFLIFSALFTFFKIPYLITNVISFSIGTIIVCYLQKTWTFRYKSKKRINFYLKYLFTIGVIFIINSILLIFGVEIIHLGEINSKLIQVILSSIIGYLIQKNFVFNKVCQN
jgi:putative flippase GtrA